MSLKLIPPKLDQVLVGSIERSRHPDLKAVFLVGVTQKDFPSAIASDVLLTEDDKELGDELGLELGDSLIEKLSSRQYLAYIAFTRASEYLYISYPRADSSGKEELRSAFLNNVVGLFGDLEERGCGESGGTVSDRLCRWLGAESSRKKEELSRSQRGMLYQLHGSGKGRERHLLHLQ